MNKRNARLLLMCMLLPLLGLTMVGWTWDPDYDGDGIPNKLELRIGTNPALADTDGDGYTDYEEIVEYGFDPSLNPYKFSPWVADVPMLGITSTSPPEPYLEYSISDMESRTFETTRSAETARSTGWSTTDTRSESAEIKVTSSASYSMKDLGGASVSVETGYKQETSHSYSREASQENRRTVGAAEAYETSTEVQERSGGLLLTAEIENRGHLAFQIENLILTAVTNDYDEPGLFRPIGNLTLDTSEDYVDFPEVTIGPGEKIGPLNFCNRDLDLNTAKRLLWDSNSIIVDAPYFELVDAEGMPFAFHQTEIQARTATIIIDYSRKKPQERYMVATNTHPHPRKNTVTLEKVLKKYLRIPFEEGTIDWPDPLVPGSLKAATGIYNIRGTEAFYDPADPSKKGWWILLRDRNNGVEWEPSVYDMANEEFGNYTSADVELKPGDVLHIMYVEDKDGDGVYSRQELLWCSRDEDWDSDDDGIDDAVEVANGTFPGNPDTDGDGLNDLADPDPLVPSSYAVAVGFTHQLLIKADGTLWAWGENECGQLGLGYTGIDFSTPQFVHPGGDWLDISAGNRHSAAVKADGTLWAWGKNEYGQCGQAPPECPSPPCPCDWSAMLVPTQVGADTDWFDVEAAWTHTMARKDNGSLWGWGYNNNYVLGFGVEATPYYYPRLVDDDGWITIATGEDLSAGIRPNGSLWEWGRFGYSFQNKPITGEKADLEGKFMQVTVSGGAYGAGHSLALETDGTLWGWGNNYMGVLGNGTKATVFTEVMEPVAVSTGWKEIFTGPHVSLGIREDGSLWAWGDNYFGQLGVSCSYSPEILGILDLHSVKSLAVQGSYAYVVYEDWSTPAYGLNVVDISDPENPVTVGSLPMPTFDTAQVAVSGNYAYVAYCEWFGSADGLVVVDISNPLSPFEVGSLPTASGTTGLAVSDNYAYVTNIDLDFSPLPEDPPIYYGGLSVVDVSDPANPVEVAYVPMQTYAGAASVAVSGTHAYVRHFGNNYYILDGEIEGITIVDISDPMSPSVVTSLELENLTGLVSIGEWSEVQVSGDYAYVATDGVLSIIDVHDPALPEQVASFDTYCRSPNEVAVEGNYAYLLCDSSLQIIDITDPTSPTLFDGVLLGTGGASDVAVSGNYGYVTSTWSVGNFLVIDFMAGGEPPVESLVPMRVGTRNDWVEVSVGDSRVLAITSDGFVWGWGGFSYTPECITSIIPGVECP